MRTAPIVMADELAKDFLQMASAQWDDPVKALSANGSDQSLAKCVRLRRAPRRLQYVQTEASQFGVEPWREDSVAIVNKKTVRMLERENLPKLLYSPFGCRMVGDIEMQDSPRTNLHSHEYVDDLESGSDGHEEIAGNYRARVVSYKSAPALIPRSTSRAVSSEIFADRSRRDTNPEFQ